MKEAPRRRITIITSSINEIYTDQLGKRVVALFRQPPPLSSSGFRAQIFKILRCPRIDSKESIPLAYVAWRADITTLFLLGS
jgi:hypothetical protein